MISAVVLVDMLQVVLKCWQSLSTWYPTVDMQRAVDGSCVFTLPSLDNVVEHDARRGCTGQLFSEELQSCACDATSVMTGVLPKAELLPM